MEKIYLLQIRIDFPDGTFQDRTIGYTTEEKALDAWCKEVYEFQIKYEVDIVLDDIAIGEAFMNRQGVEAHIWIEGLKIEE